MRPVRHAVLWFAFPLLMLLLLAPNFIPSSAAQTHAAVPAVASLSECFTPSSSVDTQSLVLKRPCAITQPLAIRNGQSLRFAAPVTISAAITLGGNNQVSCKREATLTATIPSPFQSTADNLLVSGCTVNGKAGGEMLVSKGSHVKTIGNTTTGIGLLSAGGGSDYEARGNTIANVQPGYGVVIATASYVTVVENRCSRVADCVEVFNADADQNKNPRWRTDPAGRRAYLATLAGHYRFANNYCRESVACYWTSAAHDVEITGNVADGCADVCIDLEGSQDAVIEDNIVRNGANGGYTTFFYADNIVFSGGSGFSTNGSPLILFRNSTADPNNAANITVNGMTLAALHHLAQVGGEAISQFTFANNTLYNVHVAWSAFGSGHQYTGNTLSFDFPAGAAFAALSTPNFEFGRPNEIRDNTIYSSVAQPAGSSAITALSSDFNFSNTVTIAGNHLLGGFPVDISTNNLIGNAGLTMTTVVSGNEIAANRVEHAHTGAAHDDYRESGQTHATAGAPADKLFVNAPTAPETGAPCGSKQWVFGQDDHISYCDGRRFTRKL